MVHGARLLSAKPLCGGERVLESIGAIFSAVKQTSPVIFLGIAIATAVALFGGESVAASLGISELRNQYRLQLGVAFLLASSLLAAQGLGALGRFLVSLAGARRKRQQAREAIDRRRKTLQLLTPDEKAYLAPFILRGENTQYFQIEDGVAAGLVAKEILYRPSSVGDILNGFAHNVQPWAREYPGEHPELLAGANPSPQGPPTRW
jgi:hypothetical protein